MRIRQATPEDARSIAVIHVAASLAAYRGLVPDQHLAAFTVERREAIWREILTTGDADVWIAEEDGRGQGWICVGCSRDPDAGPTTAEVRAMYIQPASWRQGIGRALWAEAEAHCRSQEFSTVTLWVFEANTRAVAFYRSLGFTAEPERTITRDRAGVRLTELRLRHDLQR
jgi:GNAT superfamily N-acetyltransferase